MENKAKITVFTKRSPFVNVRNVHFYKKIEKMVIFLIR